jgi:hypothetical protein
MDLSIEIDDKSFFQLSKPIDRDGFIYRDTNWGK